MRGLDTDGATLVEFGILLPVMILIVIGGLDLGMAMLQAQRLQFATQAAATCQATGNANCLTAAATQIYAGTAAGVAPGNFTVTAPPCGVQVTASYSFRPLILPLIPLSAGACFL